MTELCACSHANDHRGKRCPHPVGNDVAEMCPCTNGRRVDIAALEVAYQTQATLMRLLAVTESAAGMQSRLVTDDDGVTYVEVRQRPKDKTLILPG